MVRETAAGRAQWPGNQSPPRHTGQTLLEMIVVIAIIGLIAAIAVPSANPTSVVRLDLSAAEVAEAFRFARTEARRTRQLHGVSIDVAGDLVRVFRIDEGPNPDVRVFDVRHPISKQLYSFQLGTAPYAGVAITGVGGQLVGACSEPNHIAFDYSGVVRCSLPVVSRIENATVDLTAGAEVRTIALDSYTGKVSVL